MDKINEPPIIEEELEKLREKLNNNIVKIIKYMSDEEYENLLAISKKLDEVIVNYIKSNG